jgi:dynein heavy chain
MQIAQRRIDEHRNAAEKALRDRIRDFEKRLDQYYQQAESFQSKTDGIRSSDIKSNVTQLDELQSNLAQAREEAARVAREQALLEQDIITFPQVQQAESLVEPFEKLWRTADKFMAQTEAWMSGSFLDLNAEEIEEELGQLFRQAFKLTKQLADYKGPGKAAEQLRAKVDDFKKHVPIIQVVCNPGLQDRHWEKISDLSGYDLKPDATTTLGQVGRWMTKALGSTVLTYVYPADASIEAGKAQRCP